MVAMLSSSSLAPYMPDMPMQPSASGKTWWEPRARVVVMTRPYYVYVARRAGHSLCCRRRACVTLSSGGTVHIRTAVIFCTLVALGGCAATDPCNGVAGTCIALTRRRAERRLRRPSRHHRRRRDAMSTTRRRSGLPVQVAIVPPSAARAASTIDVTGYLARRAHRQRQHRRHHRRRRPHQGDGRRSRRPAAAATWATTWP